MLCVAGELENLIKATKAEEQREIPRGDYATETDWDSFMSSLDHVDSLPIDSSVSATQQSSLQEGDYSPTELVGLGLFEQLPSFQLMEDL